eukprot:381298-Alexandrium_andersonii.AAC.1
MLPTRMLVAQGLVGLGEIGRRVVASCECLSPDVFAGYACVRACVRMCVCVRVALVAVRAC